VRPAQFVTQCVIFWEGQIKLTHIPEVALVEALAELEGQLPGEMLQYRPAIGCARPALLFVFHNKAANIPLHAQQEGIRLSPKLCTGLPDDQPHFI
jgi:hypothetical protein